MQSSLIGNSKVLSKHRCKDALLQRVVIVYWTRIDTNSNNIMQAVEEADSIHGVRLVYRCNQCDFTEESREPCVFKVSFKAESRWEFISWIEVQVNLKSRRERRHRWSYAESRRNEGVWVLPSAWMCILSGARRWRRCHGLDLYVHSLQAQVDRLNCCTMVLSVLWCVFSCIHSLYCTFSLLCGSTFTIVRRYNNWLIPNPKSCRTAFVTALTLIFHKSKKRPKYHLHSDLPLLINNHRHHCPNASLWTSYS